MYNFPFFCDFLLAFTKLNLANNSGLGSYNDAVTFQVCTTPTYIPNSTRKSPLVGGGFEKKAVAMWCSYKYVWQINNGGLLTGAQHPLSEYGFVTLFSLSPSMHREYIFGRLLLYYMYTHTTSTITQLIKIFRMFSSAICARTIITALPFGSEFYITQSSPQMCAQRIFILCVLFSIWICCRETRIKSPAVRRKVMRRAQICQAECVWLFMAQLFFCHRTIYDSVFHPPLFGWYYKAPCRFIGTARLNLK